MYLYEIALRLISLDFGDGNSTSFQVMTFLSELWLPVEPQDGLSWEFSIDCVFELVWVNWHTSMSIHMPLLYLVLPHIMGYYYKL